MQRTTGYSCLMKVRCSQGPFTSLLSFSTDSPRDLQACVSQITMATSTSRPRPTSPLVSSTRTRLSPLFWNTLNRLQRASSRLFRALCCIPVLPVSAACGYAI